MWNVQTIPDAVKEWLLWDLEVEHGDTVRILMQQPLSKQQTVSINIFVFHVISWFVDMSAHLWFSHWTKHTPLLPFYVNLLLCCAWIARWITQIDPLKLWNKTLTLRGQRLGSRCKVEWYSRGLAPVSLLWLISILMGGLDRMAGASH